MKQIAFLEYMFMFDPSEAWSHLFEFEQEIARFFRQCGLEATIIKPVEGQQSRRMLYLKKAEVIKPISNPQGRPKTPQEIMKGMQHQPSHAERTFGNQKLNMNKPILSEWGKSRQQFSGALKKADSILNK